MTRTLLNPEINLAYHVLACAILMKSGGAKQAFHAMGLTYADEETRSKAMQKVR